MMNSAVEDLESGRGLRLKYLCVCRIAVKLQSTTPNISMCIHICKHVDTIRKKRNGSATMVSLCDGANR